jgi:hypothetical protein
MDSLVNINHNEYLPYLQGDSGGPLHVINGTVHSIVGKLTL